MMRRVLRDGGLRFNGEWFVPCRRAKETGLTVFWARVIHKTRGAGVERLLLYDGPGLHSRIVGNAYPDNISLTDTTDPV